MVCVYLAIAIVAKVVIGTSVLRDIALIVAGIRRHQPIFRFGAALSLTRPYSS